MTSTQLIGIAIDHFYGSYFPPALHVLIVLFVFEKKYTYIYAVFMQRRNIYIFMCMYTDRVYKSISSVNWVWYLLLFEIIDICFAKNKKYDVRNRVVACT